MKITNIKTGTISVPLLKPFKTALRSIDCVNSVIVAIETDTGEVGYGEAPPTGAITGDSLGGIKGAIHEFITPKLIGKKVENFEEIFSTLEKSCAKNTSAKAAIDIAIHDLIGKLYKIPLYKFLGGFRNKIETDITISVNSPEEMVQDALNEVSRGFRILKIKVGKEPELDLKRIEMIRKAVGQQIKLRIDANQGWTPKEAIRIMHLIESANLNIELLEQPIPAHDLKGMKMVRNAISTPILADESVFTFLDAERLVLDGAADYINIKLMKTGGIRSALRICALAETHSVECFIGCMMETKLSVTAAAHLACAKQIITRFDLDSPLLCTQDPVHGGVIIDIPNMIVSDLPGLGIEHIDNVLWDQ